MKFGGAELGVNYETVTFKRGGKDITLKVTPLPFGWRERIEATGAVDAPAPPKVILRKPDGRPERDSAGLALQSRNEDDPDYIKAKAAVNGRMLALTLAEHLREEPGIQWDTKPPAVSDKNLWQAYANDLYNEVASSGLTETEIGLILSAGRMASLDIDVEKVADDFLSELDEMSPEQSASQS